MEDSSTNSNSLEYTVQGDMCWGVLSTKQRSTELIATAESLILKGPLGRKFEFSAKEVDQIAKGRFHFCFLNGFAFGSIRIFHSKEKYPKKILFTGYYVKPNEMMNSLKSLGYQVSV